MVNDRLTSDVWIMAHVRRCNAEGVPAMVVRRGDDRAGSLILKLNRLDGTCKLLSPFFISKLTTFVCNVKHGVIFNKLRL